MSRAPDSLTTYTAEEDRSTVSDALGVLATYWRRRELVLALTRRDVQARYRGSLLGLLWSFLNPMLMLAIYTLVFAGLLKARWAGAPEGIGGFAVMLFAGMIPYQFLSESLSRSSIAIVSSPNYVKKVAFPVELLSFMTVGTALVHALISLLILMGGMLLLTGHISQTVFWVPVISLPLFTITVAAALAVSVLGVFLRDLPHILGVLLTVLMFGTPIFYPATLIPERFLMLVKINPLAYTVTNFQRVCVLGWQPEWQGWLYCMAAGVFLLVMAAWWFNIIRRRLSDVL